MSRIPPATSLTDVAIRALADAQASHATLDRPPQALLRLSPGTQIPGTVVGQDGKGGLLVQSPQGTLTLHTRANLPQGSQILIQVDGNTPQSRTVTVTLAQPASGNAQGGNAPAPQTAIQSQTSAQAAASGQTSAGANSGSGAAAGNRPAAPGSPAVPASHAIDRAPAAILGDARSITATVTRPAPAGANPALPPQAETVLRPVLATQGQPGLVPGSRLTVRVVGLEAPPPPAGAPASTTPTAAAANTVANPAPGAPQPPPTPAPTGPGTTAPPQANAPARPQNAPAPVALPQPAAAPGAPAPAVSAGLNGVLVAATVTGSTGVGQPVLQTALGELTLAARANLAPGSRATLQVISAEPAATARPTAPPPSTGLDLSREWPALKDALAALQQINPAGVGRAAAEAIPRPGPGLANDLLFLITAMRLGDLRSWLGQQATRTLASSQPELAGRLGDDFGKLARFAGEAPPGEWRAYFLPIHDGHSLQQIRFFSRRQKRKDAQSQEDEAATRVVVEVDLTQLGPLQLDGLAHDGRFDLIVRSRASLPEEMRRAIVGIFAEVRGSAQWDGELGFQAVPVFPVAPLEEIDARHIGVVV